MRKLFVIMLIIPLLVIEGGTKMVQPILATDTLNEGRVKINAAILEAGQAINTANNASGTATTAATTAGAALSQAQSTQEQLNQIVIEGDSSVEAAQARVDGDGVAYGSLKERLDTKDAIAEEIGEQAKNKIVDLFAGMGQSNMQGQSLAAPVPFELPQYKAYEYKLLTDTLTTVKHPFGENIDDLLLAADQGYGSLSPRFAEAYYNATGVAPLMVGVAKGSTQVTDWIGNARYAKVVEKVNGAVECAEANGLIVRSKNLVWLQGESDGMFSVSKQAYKDAVLSLWEDLKADCGFEKMFIIRVAKFFSYPMIPIINAQEELAKEHDDIIMLTRITGTFTEGNGYLQVGNWHYSNAGLDLVGATAGKAVGKYLNTGTEPKLEAEPYTEVSKAGNGTYSWNFRDGSIVGGINIIGIGSPSITPPNAVFNGTSGFSLEKGMVLDEDATISLTCYFTEPLNAGGMLVSYDGLSANSFIFFYHTLSVINMADPLGKISKFFNTDAIYDVISTYNHYVIQKVGKTYSLYFNGELVQTIYNGPETLNINTLFYGADSLGLKGSVRHCMISKGSVIAPKDADPTFYANSEQGTT